MNTNRTPHQTDSHCQSRLLREAMGPGYQSATFRDQRFLRRAACVDARHTG